MDIAVSVINITNVTLRASSKLWELSGEWRDAPADLHKLRDDMSAAENFFREIHQHLCASHNAKAHVQDTSRPIGLDSIQDASRLIGASPGKPPECLKIRDDLTQLLDEGTLILRRIEEVVDGLAAIRNGADKDPPSKENVMEMGKRRKLRWLQQSKKVSRLRKELWHTRSIICQLLISENIFLSASLSSSVQGSRSEVMSQISNISTSIESSHNRMLTQIEHRIDAMEERMLRTGIWDRQLASNPAQQHTWSARGTQHLLPARPQAQIMPGRSSLCDISCSCSCHGAVSYAWNMALLRSVVGMIAVAYTSWNSGPCTNPGCMRQGRGARDIHVTYHLPDWLARSSVSTFFSTNLNGSPQLIIRMHYRRPWQAALIALFRAGDVEGVKSWIREGRMSVYDLYDNLMYSALWLSFLAGIEINNHSITKLLLQAGADPFAEVSTLRSSVMSRAFEMSLANPETFQELAEFLPVHKYMEELDVSPLHLAVLRRNHDSLAILLQDPIHTSRIDARAEGGLTALHFAAIQGNADATKLLVRAGADVDSQSISQATPLILAARYNRLDVARVLVSAGANVRAQTDYGWEPIHSAAVLDKENSTALLALFVKHGAPVNAPNAPPQVGVSPFLIALDRGTVDALRFFLENGANPDERHDGDGSPAILEAIFHPQHARAELLLAHGADMTAVSNGHNALHCLALVGDAKMMRIFSEAKFRGLIDTSLKDRHGKTPLNLLNERNPDSETREAFSWLLDSVERRNSINMSLVPESDDGISDGEFFDAESNLGQTLGSEET